MRFAKALLFIGTSIISAQVVAAESVPPILADGRQPNKSTSAATFVSRGRLRTALEK